MNEHFAERGTGREWYEIRLQGRLSSGWSTHFAGMTMTALDDGTTVLLGPVADQAALHGLLRRLGDLGLHLLSVRQQADDKNPPLTTPTVEGD
jgi:hypothetical protein